MPGNENEVNGDKLSVGSGSASGDSVSNGISTVHRETLNRLAEDAVQSKRHVVPDSKVRPSNPAWYSREGVQSYQEQVLSMGPEDWLHAVFPITKCLKYYEWKANFPRDLIAGCTVGFMVVPQSLSYAKLAGLPVQYGLYSALVPTLAYAAFGTSRQLAVGPVALVSLVIANGIESLLKKRGITSADEAYKQAYIQAAIQSSFLVGVSYLILGLLRLGFLTILLSHAVVSGFISASAIIIGCSQLKYFFGYSIPQTEILHHVFQELFKRIDQFNWRTFLLGVCALALLMFMKNIGSFIPKLKYIRVLGPLVVTVIGIILDLIIDFPAHDIQVVGAIPKGLPTSTVHYWLPIKNFSELVPVVLSVGLVGFMESIAIAKRMAAQHKYSIDSSSELVGLGLSNLLGSMAGAFPVTGSFSRSAVNNDTGAQSGLSGIVTGTMVLFVLLFLTPVFGKVPLPILGAIVISAVIGLVDYQEAMSLWKIDKFDFVVWVVSFVCTLFAGVELGLLVAVGVSLLMVIYESAYPHTAVLGRLPGTTVYRNVKQYPEAETFDGIVLIRIDAPIYFANTQNIRDKLTKYEELAQAGKMQVKYIILELSPVSHIDSSALHILKEIIDAYKMRNIELCFSNPSVRVMDRMLLGGLVEKVGRDHIFVTAHDAVNFCLQELDIAESQHGVKILDDSDLEEQAHRE